MSFCQSVALPVNSKVFSPSFVDPVAIIVPAPPPINASELRPSRSTVSLNVFASLTELKLRISLL